LQYTGKTSVVCTYHNRGISSLCFGSQHSTEADWMSGFEVTVYHAKWWHISFKGQRQS